MLGMAGAVCFDSISLESLGNPRNPIEELNFNKFYITCDLH